MKLLNKATTIFNRALDILVVLAAAFLIFIMLGIPVEVLLRKVWGQPIIWMNAMAGYSLVWITFLVAAWVLRDEAHVKMDLLLNRLSPRTQALLNAVTSVLGIIICLAITWLSVQVAWDYFQTDYRMAVFWRPPKFPLFLVIPVGSFLLIIQFVRRSWKYLQIWRASPDQRQHL